MNKKIKFDDTEFEEDEFHQYSKPLFHQYSKLLF